VIYSLSIAEAAENDIREAFLWYEKQKEGLGKRFEERINKAVESIQRNPVKTQIRYNNVRIFFLAKFPFGIHFQVIENHILIVAVFHTSQDPEKWNTRP
jgi:toxin ParE1/3/4